MNGMNLVQKVLQQKSFNHEHYYEHINFPVLEIHKMNQEPNSILEDHMNNWRFTKSFRCNFYGLRMKIGSSFIYLNFAFNIIINDVSSFN